MAAGLYDITNEVLGKGHFAVVKLARHCLTGESVAIKIIDKIKLAKDGLGQLRHEIRLWSILSEHEHPNVVKLYQCIDTRSKLYLVMEYCGRKVCDLFDHIQRRNGGNGLPEPEARHIFQQVCSAIHYCHSLRIVHRDLKPENILIIADPTSGFDAPQVKICDFGFSNQWSRESILLRTSCGSLAYSAPEILLGNHYNAPMIDIWALGCILYIMVYGINPFMQCTDSETLIKILDCSFVTPSRESLSEEAILLIRGLLRKVPEERLSIDQVMTDHWFTSGDSSLPTTTTTKPITRDSATKHDSDTEEQSQPGSDSNSNECDKSCPTNKCDSNGDCAAKSQPSLKHDKNGNIGRNVTKSYCKVKEVVNDQIIDAMILRGINLSKDVIKRMLTEDGKAEPHHEIHHHEERNGTPPNCNSNPAGIVHKSQEVNHRQYVRATYQLLKDKCAREVAGPNSAEDSDNFCELDKEPEEHEKSSRMLFNAKRGKLGARRTLLGNGKAGSNPIRPLCSRPPELAPLPETLSGGLFALPLARKCSIVSEEGFGTEGNTPEPPVSGMDGEPERLLTPEVVPEDDDAVELDKIRSQSPLFNPPAVFITDTSHHSIHSPLHEKPRFNVLHPVSSSPDFLVDVKYAEDEENELKQKSDMMMNVDSEDLKSGNRMVESVGRKNSADSKNGSIGSSIFERFSRKQPLGLSNVRISKNRIVDEQATKPPTPSMRVIIQSKSLNNIALTDGVSRQDSPTSNGVSGKATGNSTDMKIVNSMSAASIGKIVRGDKADCCVIS